VGFLEVLTTVFVVGKLMGWLDWPWLYVFAPVLIEGLLVILIACALFATRPVRNILK
jgi:hypothetical protein